MKTVFIVLAANWAFSVATAQFIYSPLPVKESDFKKIYALGYTKCYVYKVQGEEKTLYQEAEYGAKGLVAGFYDKGFNDNGDTINKTELFYKFDGKGRLINTSFTDKENNGTDEPSLYTYNSAGRLVKRETAEIDPPTYYYKWDGKGKLKEVYVTQRMPEYDSAGEFHGKSFEASAYRYIYKYDKAGRMAEEWEYMLRGEDSKIPSYKARWTYDAKGRVISLERLTGSNAVTSLTTYEYNSDGLLAKSLVKEDSEATNYVYEYCKGCKQSWMQ